MRNLSSGAKSAIFAQQTGEAILVLIELSHPSFVSIMRFTANDQDVISGGNTYLAFPFEITLPDDEDDVPPKASLKIDNVDRRIVSEVRRVSGQPIEVRLFIVTASSPDTIEAGPYSFVLRDTTYTAASIEGSLAYDDILSEPFPADSFTPVRFPGLFQ